MSENDPIEGELLPVTDEEYIVDMPPVVSNSVEPADIIKSTQTIRVALVKKAVRHGVPDLDKDSGALLQVLRDMDQAALTTRKIDVEESQLGDAERLAHAHGELLRMLGGKNPFAIDIKSDHINLPAERVVNVDLPEPVLVDGIDAQGTVPVDYDSFVDAVRESERLLEEDGQE